MATLEAKKPPVQIAGFPLREAGPPLPDSTFHESRSCGFPVWGTTDMGEEWGMQNMATGCTSVPLSPPSTLQGPVRSHNSWVPPGRPRPPIPHPPHPSALTPARGSHSGLWIRCHPCPGQKEGSASWQVAARGCGGDQDRENPAPTFEPCLGGVETQPSPRVWGRAGAL